VLVAVVLVAPLTASGMQDSWSGSGGVQSGGSLDAF
jgi:hypothetical protein